jgi:hypothetical protein
MVIPTLPVPCPDPRVPFEAVFMGGFMLTEGPLTLTSFEADPLGWLGVR